MFLAEARLAARLNHPHVVQTYDVGEDDGRYYLAMEYVDGQTLETARRSPDAARLFPPRLQLQVLAHVLSGLHYAHELKDYDGKPLNVVPPRRHAEQHPPRLRRTGEARRLRGGEGARLRDPDPRRGGEGQDRVHGSRGLHRQRARRPPGGHLLGGGAPLGDAGRAADVEAPRIHRPAPASDRGTRSSPCGELRPRGAAEAGADPPQGAAGKARGPLRHRGRAPGRPGSLPGASPAPGERPGDRRGAERGASPTTGSRSPRSSSTS